MLQNHLARFYDGNSWHTFWLNVVSGFALLCGAAWFSYNLFSTKDADLPPRVVNSVTIEPTTLLAGGPFIVHRNVTINRPCPYEVRWSLVRKEDGVEIIKVVEPVKQPPDQLGTQELPPVTRVVPPTVAPGEYKYVSEVFDICPDGHTYTSVRRNIEISIR